MKLVILPQASLELQEAVEYYEAEQSGLGERLFFFSREDRAFTSMWDLQTVKPSFGSSPRSRSQVTTG
jgi:hypothetical protein